MPKRIQLRRTKEKGIIFSGPMVRAILDGRKSATRQVCKRLVDDALFQNDCRYQAWLASECPYKAGQHLWVKESFTEDGMQFYPHLAVMYKADGGIEVEDGKVYSPESKRWYPFKWRSPIHMPRWASRITLEVKAVWVERLQDISEEDAKAEGVVRVGNPLIGVPMTYRTGYERVWDEINGKKHPWSSNPWVHVIEFKLANKEAER